MRQFLGDIIIKRNTCEKSLCKSDNLFQLRSFGGREFKVVNRTGGKKATPEIEIALLNVFKPSNYFWKCSTSPIKV